MDSRMSKERLQGKILNGLRNLLYHWKIIQTLMSKMGLHDPFGHLKHKLWPKEGSGIKLAIWLQTIKSQESTQFPCMQVACHISLESFWWALQLCFRPHLNRRSAHKVMGPQSRGSPNFRNFRTPIRLPFGSPETKCHLDVGLMERHKIYYKREGGDSPQLQVVVSLVSPSLPVTCPNTKSAPTMH
jgi:hypothetical protein